MPDLSIDTSATRKKLTDFIHAQITSAGFNKAVIGLSGGIDSALACALAVEALGAQNVLAVRMPYKTSSKSSLDDAQLLIDELKVPSLTLPITDMVEPLFNRFPDMDQRRKGNIMARQRMIILFDQSAIFQGLVVGTGNKTEILLGYSTLFGDAACSLNPLGDLYKTQVRQLARSMKIPTPILEKAPSADLWTGQTDEGELGFTYDKVDQLLFLLIDQRFTPEKCVAAGFAEKFVRAVIDRIHRYQFKRVLPPIAKLGDQTLSDQLLVPLDWGS